MTLLERIDADLKQAMKDKAAGRLNAIRMLKASVKNAAIEKGGPNSPMDDEEIIKLVRREVKKREDSIESYTKANREDLAKIERAEIDILKVYLPASLSASELAALVAESVKEASRAGAPTMGAVMKLATAKAAGRVDGKTLSQAVNQALK
jgi:hypothetical protein